MGKEVLLYSTREKTGAVDLGWTRRVFAGYFPASFTILVSLRVVAEFPSIPILRQGRVYQSLDRRQLDDVRGGGPVAEVHVANSGLVKRDLSRLGEAREALAALGTEKLLAMTRRAGRHFLEDSLPLGEAGEREQSAADYVRQLAATSGLPHSLIWSNMAKLGSAFAEIGSILDGLTRGIDRGILDAGYGEVRGVPICFYPQTDALGVIMPSNSPAVNALYLPAIAMKIPLVIKPGREEPWTPWRIIQAFMRAGVPREAFSFYPADHDGSNAVLERMGRVMLFGDDRTVARHAHDARVEVHGAGHSKILIGEDRIEGWEGYLDTIEASVTGNGGRSCINASTILVPSYADEIADALARRLAQYRPLPPDDPDARLAGFANPMMAEWIDAAVSEGLEEAGAEDVTARYRTDAGRRVEVDSIHYLLPTVVRLDSVEHVLFGNEYLFPFVQVVEVSEEEMLSVMGKSLVVTAITDDAGWRRRLLSCPDIDRLNLGCFPTNRVEWNQPHEGNLFEFLYRRRAIHLGDVDVP